MATGTLWTFSTVHCCLVGCKTNHACWNKSACDSKCLRVRGLKIIHSEQVFLRKLTKVVSDLPYFESTFTRSQAFVGHVFEVVDKGAARDVGRGILGLMLHVNRSSTWVVGVDPNLWPWKLHGLETSENQWDPIGFRACKFQMQIATFLSKLTTCVWI